MADGAGTSYCADEGYFSPTQTAHLEQLAKDDARIHKGHASWCALLWQGKPCDCGKTSPPDPS
jgi:hypothetical protein